MKSQLTKLALVAAVALGSMGMARAADSGTLAAKLKSVSTGTTTSAIPAPPLDDPNKTDLRAWYDSLTTKQQKALKVTYFDLPKETRQYLRKVWADLPVSAG